MGEEKEIFFKVLAVSHLTLAKFCLTPSFLKPRYNHMHSPCNQFMRANWEAIVCIRTGRVEESLKEKLAFHRISEFSLLLLSCIFKNVTVPSDLIQVALIYQELFDLQRAPQFWLYGF